MSILTEALDTYLEIMNYQWYFELENNEVIKIVFSEEHFSHLILGTFVNNKLHKYKGKNGFYEINKINFSILETEMKRHPLLLQEVINIKKRIKYFKELKNILDNPKYFFYDIKNVCAKNKNDLDADYAILQDNPSNSIDVLYRATLFIRKKEIENHYIGVSCIVDNASYKHTSNQKTIKVLKTWKIQNVFS